jgi:hypothetical protein
MQATGKIWATRGTGSDPGHCCRRALCFTCSQGAQPSPVLSFSRMPGACRDRGRGRSPELPAERQGDGRPLRAPVHPRLFWWLGRGSTAQARNSPRSRRALTAHHQKQDDQQRGHEHQQRQPDVVPHREDRTGVASGRQAGVRRVPASAAGAGAPGRHGRQAPLGSALRGRGGGGIAAGREGRADGAPEGGGPRGAPTRSSLG